MIELRQQQKVLWREEQPEAQQEMLKLMKQAVQNAERRAGENTFGRTTVSQPQEPQPRNLIP
jgi:hypothetical protein